MKAWGNGGRDFFGWQWDPLATLLQDGNGPAHSAFTKHFMDNRLKGDLTKPRKKAIVDIDPRTDLIDLYVQDLTGSSIQGWKDLARCRDALGITGGKLGDSDLQAHQDFLNARREVVHELDLTDPSGKGTRGRRHRDIAAVGQQRAQAAFRAERPAGQGGRTGQRGVQQADVLLAPPRRARLALCKTKGTTGRPGPVRSPRLAPRSLRAATPGQL